METKILEEIGLTKTEVKIYLALIKAGESTTTPIIKESGVHASKVYEFLNKLIQKGLVSYITKNNKKYFTAHPRNLKQYIQDKEEVLKNQEEEIEHLIPKLKSSENNQESIKSETYEGLNGIKSVYNKMLSELNSGESQFVIGAPRIGNELIEGFLLDWHKKRIKKGIRCKYIYDSDARAYGKIRKEMPLTQVKFMPKNISSPVWIEIFKDYVVTGHIKGYNAILFLIKDKEISRSYLDYFNLIWKLAKK
jgi:sugar-specific transcriptional regulator TrmB